MVRAVVRATLHEVVLQIYLSRDGDPGLHGAPICRVSAEAKEPMICWPRVGARSFPAHEHGLACTEAVHDNVTAASRFGRCVRRQA
jgi:hypothetical protein